MLDVWSLLQIGMRRITTKKVVFGNSGRLPLAFLPVRLPKSVADLVLPRLSFFLAFQTSLAQLFKKIFTNCRRIHLALSKFFKGSQVSKAFKKSATALSQCRAPSRSCFRWFCPKIMDRCSFSRDSATHSFFHLLNVLKLGCPILSANCFKENSVCFKLMGDWLSAMLKSDESSLPYSASYWS